MLELVRILHALHPGFWLGLALVALPVLVAAIARALESLHDSRPRLKT
jgi:hypothetical protein